jgi:hypothetical protein
VTKLTVAFHNFANAPKTSIIYENKISLLLFVVQIRFVIGSRKLEYIYFVYLDVHAPKGLVKFIAGPES